MLSSTVALPANPATIDAIHLDGLNHTLIGDLQVVLFDPNGDGHVLVNRVNYMNSSSFGSSCDFDGNYSIAELPGLEWPATFGTPCNGGAALTPGQYAQFFFADPLGQWTQGADNMTFSSSGVACGSGGIAADNPWLRRYSPATECGVSAALIVEGVTFGVQVAAGVPGVGQPIMVRAYSVPEGAPLTYANMLPLAAIEEIVPDGTEQLITVRFASPKVLTLGYDLVIEVAKETGTSEGFVHYPGANALAQSAPSYIASLSCGLPEPTDLAAIGFPDSHLLLEPVYSTTFVGDSLCGRSEPNSSGASASIHAIGTDLLSSNDLTLSCAGLPADTFVFLLASQSEAISFPGNSEGFLCLSGSIGRGVGGAIGHSGASGTFTVAADLRSLPQPTGSVSAQCGDTWYFQGWFRDAVSGVTTSNMTDAVGVTLR